MYENKYKNQSLTSSEDLDNFLNLIAALNESLELFAIGGTAMVLKNIKESTKDIDFLTTEKYEKIQRMFNLYLILMIRSFICSELANKTILKTMIQLTELSIAGLKEEADNKICNIWRLNELRIDIFYDGFIMGIPFPEDWKKFSEKIKSIGKIDLYILNWYDLIITKISRSEKRDIDDILAIIKSQKLNFNFLKKRYYSIAETSLISDFDYKFKHLEGEYDKRKTH